MLKFDQPQFFMSQTKEKPTWQITWNSNRSWGGSWGSDGGKAGLPHLGSLLVGGGEVLEQVQQCRDDVVGVNNIWIVLVRSHEKDGAAGGVDRARGDLHE